uniref:phosphopantetheine-binding protein n=1 Tax=Pseudomonas sp. LRF_L74 TaxID=3369422 RepID=UPI003F601F8F
ELEQRIAAIWADVLKLEKVGLTDNFFELGGHSLLATKVTSRINSELGLDTNLELLFSSGDLLKYSGRILEALPIDGESFNELQEFLTELETV